MSKIIFNFSELSQSNQSAINVGKSIIALYDNKHLAISISTKTILICNREVEPLNSSKIVQLEFDETISIFKWITEDYLLIGFDDGLLILINVKEEEKIFEYQGQNNTVQALHIIGGMVWILYKSGYVVNVRVCSLSISCL